MVQALSRSLRIAGFTKLVPGQSTLPSEILPFQNRKDKERREVLGHEAFMTGLASFSEEDSHCFPVCTH